MKEVHFIAKCGWMFLFLPWAINLGFIALYYNNLFLPLSLLLDSELFVVRDWVFSLNFQCLVQCLAHGGYSVNEWAVNYTFLRDHISLPTLDGICAEINVMVFPIGNYLFSIEKSVSLLDIAIIGWQPGCLGSSPSNQIVQR